jgi:hypothetical protein
MSSNRKITLQNIYRQAYALPGCNNVLLLRGTKFRVPKCTENFLSSGGTVVFSRTTFRTVYKIQKPSCPPDPVSGMTTTRLAHVPTAARKVCLYKSNINSYPANVENKVGS